MAKGPVIGATCTVCRHPQATSINGLLGQPGYPATRIEKQFGLSRGSVLRHWRANHPGVPVVVPQGAAVPGGGFAPPAGATPRQKLELLIATLEAQAAQGNIRTDVFRELRLAYADLDKLAGGEPPAEVTVAEVRGAAELAEGLSDFVRRHPEHAAELREVLRAAGLFREA